jgi:hypothetical protein
MNETIYGRTESALDMLVQNCIEMQKIVKDKHRHLDSLAMLNEFCTVKMSGARMMGHTASAIKVAQTHFKEIAYVCLNAEQAEHLAERFGLDKKRCMGARQAKTRLAGIGLDCIVVDCSFFVAAVQMDEIVEMACHCMAHADAKCLMLIQ